VDFESLIHWELDEAEGYFARHCREIAAEEADKTPGSIDIRDHGSKFGVWAGLHALFNELAWDAAEASGLADFSSARREREREMKHVDTRRTHHFPETRAGHTGW
jgi:hypothetical protein